MLHGFVRSGALALLLVAACGDSEGEGGGGQGSGAGGSTSSSTKATAASTSTSTGAGGEATGGGGSGGGGGGDTDCIGTIFGDIPDGGSKCPRPMVDEVIHCIGGMLAAQECAPGEWCVDTGPDMAACECNDLADGLCRRAQLACEAPVRGRAEGGRQGSQLALFEHDRTVLASERRKKPWAWLLRHVFQLDVVTCVRCGGTTRLLAAATTPEAIAKLLAKHGLGPRPPPPRAAPTGQLRLAFSTA
ncbi:MAG: hypothetical protein JNL21_18690 [Myxococcales bacterium]|nr:hypothetical protein [Myxococcales bacterium]